MDNTEDLSEVQHKYDFFTNNYEMGVSRHIAMNRIREGKMIGSAERVKQQKMHGIKIVTNKQISDKLICKDMKSKNMKRA